MLLLQAVLQTDIDATPGPLKSAGSSHSKSSSPAWIAALAAADARNMQLPEVIVQLQEKNSFAASQASESTKQLQTSLGLTTRSISTLKEDVLPCQVHRL